MIVAAKEPQRKPTQTKDNLINSMDVFFFYKINWKSYRKSWKWMEISLAKARDCTPRNVYNSTMNDDNLINAMDGRCTF